MKQRNTCMRYQMLETRSLYRRDGVHLNLKGINLLALQIQKVRSELLTDK